MPTHRPIIITIATVLLVLLSVANLATIGAPSGEDGLPIVIVWASVVLGLAGLVAAVGLWQRRRWGLVAALMVLGLTVLAAAPGLVEAPSTELRVAASITVAVSALSIALLLLPSARRQNA